MFCLIVTAAAHRPKALAEEDAGLWEVGRRYMSAWTIVTSFSLGEKPFKWSAEPTAVESLYLRAGAQKKPAC